MDNWIALSLLAGLFSNIFNFGNRYVLKSKGDATSYAWLVGTVRLLAFIVIALFIASPLPAISAIYVLAALGLVEVVSAYVFMKMHAASHLSISSLIVRTRLVWVPVIAMIFLKEQLIVREYVGILILFLGLSVTISSHKLRMDKGVKLAYLSGFIIGVLTVLMKAATSVASTAFVMISMSLPTVLIFPMLMKDPKKRLSRVLVKNAGMKLIASFSNIAAMFFYTRALQVGPVSKVTSIYQGALILSVLAGIILLKEREDIIKKLIGSAGVIAGAFLLT